MTYRKWQRFVSGSACLFLPLAILPQVNEDGEITTVASWYGPGFHGKKTASGQVFDQNKMTAASKTLPFGTRIKVRNPKNGKTVTVVINDRGPFIKGRGIDLSKEAARRLGIDGIAKVCYSSVPASIPQPAVDRDVAVVASKAASKNVVASNSMTRAADAPHLEILEATPLPDASRTQEQVKTESAAQLPQALPALLQQTQPQQAAQELLTSQSLPIPQTSPIPQALPTPQVSQSLPTVQSQPTPELSTVLAMRRFVDEQSRMAPLRQYGDEPSQLAMMRSFQLIERADAGSVNRPGQRIGFEKKANLAKPKALAQKVAKDQQPAPIKKVHQFTASVRGVIQTKPGRHQMLQTNEIGYSAGNRSPYHQHTTTKISHSVASVTSRKMLKPKLLIAAQPRKAAPRVHKLAGTRVAKQTRSKRNQQYIAYKRNLKHSVQKTRYVAKSGEKEGRMVARTVKKWGSKLVHVYKGLRGLFASL